MKYIYNFFAIALAVLFFVSCDTKEDNFSNKANPNSGWVQFDENNHQDALSTDVMIRIPVYLHTATNLKGVTVHYTTDFNFGTSSIDFGSSVLIPAGTDIGYIEFTPIETDDTYEVKFTLEGTNDSNYSVGLSDGSKPIEYTVKVCSVAIGSTYQGVSTAFGADFTPFTATLVAGTNANEYLIDTAWGMNFVAEATGNPAYSGQYIYSGKIIVNPADNTIQIVGDDTWATGGTGVFNPCESTFSYTLTQALFSNSFTVDVVLSAQ